MSDAFVGQIALFPYTFTNLRNWHPCDGSLLQVSQYQALASLIGFTYGGNGSSTFGLPDLRGRVPVGAGAAAPGRSAYTVGQTGGAEQVGLQETNLAGQAHPISIQVAKNGTTSLAAGEYLSASFGVPASPTPALIALAGGSSGTVGSGTPFSVLQPFLAMTYFICLQGIYPSRS